MWTKAALKKQPQSKKSLVLLVYPILNWASASEAVFVQIDTVSKLWRTLIQTPLISSLSFSNWPVIKTKSFQCSKIIKTRMPLSFTISAKTHQICPQGLQACIVIFLFNVKNPTAAACILFNFPHWRNSFLKRRLSKWIATKIKQFKVNFKEHVVAFDANLVHRFKLFVNALSKISL